MLIGALGTLVKETNIVISHRSRLFFLYESLVFSHFIEFVVVSPYRMRVVFCPICVSMNCSVWNYRGVGGKHFFRCFDVST